MVRGVARAGHRLQKPTHPRAAMHGGAT
jgi:hypothetical protein